MAYVKKTITERLNECEFTFLERGDFRVSNALVFYRNFEGRPTNINPEGGKSTFCLALPDDVADMLADRGWNVKIRMPRNEGDIPVKYTECVVNMGSVTPPRVEFITNFNGIETTTPLTTQSSLKRLDEARLARIDLYIWPYKHDRKPYTFKGYANGIKAWQANVQNYGGLFDDEHPEE